MVSQRTGRRVPLGECSVSDVAACSPLPTTFMALRTLISSLVAVAVLLGETIHARTSAATVTVDSSRVIRQDDGLVVVSLQGASLERTRALAVANRLPTLATLGQRGSGLAATIPVDAPATATARATFETGASPSAHGIVGNTFHVRGDSITVVRSGFRSAFQTETLYDAAARQGRSAATVGSASISDPDPRVARVTAGRPLQGARVVSLSPGREADTTVRMMGRDTAWLVLSVTGNRINASVRFSSGGDTVIALAPGAWTPVWLSRTSPRAGSWTKVLEHDSEERQTRIYLGATIMTDATPASVATDLEMRAGPAPGTPDWAHHSAGAIDDITWREQVMREAEYLTLAAERVRATVRPALLVLALNLLDAHEHQFLRVHPRHPVFGRADSSEQARWRGWIEEAYTDADAMVARAAAGASNVIVASEYGLLPVHSRLQLAAALRRRGYRVTGDTADLRVMASSASAQIRLNVRGREPTGSRQDQTALMGRLARELREIRDPASNVPVIARIETSTTMRRRGETSPAFGDLRVIANPGYTFGDLTDAADVFDVPFLPGEHAFDSRLPETHGIFVAAGNGVRARRIRAVDAVDVAVTAAALLGIDPPRGSTGRSRQ